jgi:hypothetical protein
MRRLEALDGLRGYFLVFMMLNHLYFEDSFFLGKMNHQELGYVQDAQGFVFLSGLLIGMVYTGRMRREGFWAGASKIWRRALDLYIYAMGCILAIVALSMVLPEANLFWYPWLWQLVEGQFWFIVSSALLLYQPSYMDILPQYIIYLIVAPPLVWLCIQGRWLPIAIGSALLWLAVQFGAHIPLSWGVEGAMQVVDPELGFRAPFNVLAWQTVFMSGMVLGSMSVTGQIDWQRTFDPRRAEIFWAAVAIVLFFMAWRLALTYQIVPEATVRRFRSIEIRNEFSLLFLVNFAAMAYMVGWLMIAGVRSEHPWIKAVGDALHALFSLSFLRLLGRHSLQVYAFHVIVVYFSGALGHHYGPFGDVTETFMALAAVASLAIPALIHERWMARKRGEAKPPAQPAAQAQGAGA